LNLAPATQLAIRGGSPAVTCPIHTFSPVSPQEEFAILQSLRTSPLTTLYGGYDVERFERSFAERFGFAHCVAMSSGTSSLHAALVAIGVGPGDEVIVPTLSFVATVSVVVQQGAIPVFCDIDPVDLCLNVDQCLSMIGPRTKAIMMVHLYGMPMKKIQQLAELDAGGGPKLIEDCACAIGSSVNRRYVGDFGAVGCFSFNVGKLLRVGEGGMAVTRSAELAEVLRELRVNGLSPHKGVNNVNRLGFNYTLAQPLAAVGVVQLTVFDQLLQCRRENLRILAGYLDSLPLRFLPTPPLVEPVPYMTPLFIEKQYAPMRSLILRSLVAEGVPVSAGYGEPLYRINYLRQFALDQEFPVTESVIARLLVVDLPPYIPSAQIHEIGLAFRKVFSNLHVIEGLHRDVPLER
jgi:perosamine synthetase